MVGTANIFHITQSLSRRGERTQTSCVSAGHRRHRLRNASFEYYQCEIAKGTCLNKVMCRTKTSSKVPINGLRWHLSRRFFCSCSGVTCVWAHSHADRETAQMVRSREVNQWVFGGRHFVFLTELLKVNYTVKKFRIYHTLWALSHSTVTYSSACR